MVFWELTLATAYVLGLKRTYKLALRLQRRLISPRHPRLREFAQRRTRNVFDVALTVHRKIQERDIEVGRNIGNRILRWLDRMKPSANIRGDPPSNLPSNEVRSTTNTVGASSSTRVNSTNGHQDSGRSLFVGYMPVSRKSDGYFTSVLKKRDSGRFPLNSGIAINALPKMTHGLFWQPVRHNVRSLGSCTNTTASASLTSLLQTRDISKGVIREDIAMWMQQENNSRV